MAGENSREKCARLDVGEVLLASASEIPQPRDRAVEQCGHGPNGRFEISDEACHFVLCEVMSKGIR